MKTKYKYIHFREFPGYWSCKNNKSKVTLGIVEYYRPWKQWCYIPFSTSVVFSADCLDDISHFLGQLNKK